MSVLDLDGSGPEASEGGESTLATTAVPTTPGVIDIDADGEEGLPKNAVLNADRSVTLTLDYPVTLKVKKNGAVTEQVYNSLTFHRLTGADQRAIAAASEEATVAVTFARSTRTMQLVMNALFDLMDMADIDAGGRIISGFLPSGRKTGRRS